MRWGASIGALGAAACALFGGAVAADAKPRMRIETRVHSHAPDRRVVRESYVSLYAPLPASDGPRPRACDRIGYLRYRDARGPRKARKAAAIFVTMPGIFAGSTSLDIFARNMVRTARAHHRHVEVWALDRRSNCLEDHYGIHAAARRHDYRLALRYYYEHGAIGGRRFGGFRSEQDAQFLKGVGLDQTARDEYTVITRGIPRKLRRRKVFCGGHSLGGPLTTAFADWDFDGNKRTTRDAGFNQCAGFFALDTRFTLASGGSGGGSSGGGGPGAGLQGGFAQASGASPYVNAPPFTPETIEAVPNTALAAFQQPRALSHVLDYLPNDQNFQVTFRLLFSRDAVNAVTQVPNIRDFRVTNETSLAATFDDNSSPSIILRASLGTFAGGPVAEKNFPEPYGSTNGGLVNGRALMIPTAPHGPLYRWWSFRQFGKPGTPVQRDSSGHRFTTKASEVTDIHQFARAIWEAPADYTEQYFPTRLLVDQSDASNGDRSGSLQNLRYDGIPKRPQFYADAQHGIEDGADPPPKGPKPRMWVKLRGYDHLDVGTAALRQNDGRHERESAGLWRWATKVVAKHRRQARDRRRHRRHKKHHHHHHHG